MANLTFNIALGRVVHYSTLPAAADALILVPIETTGIEADATLRDHDNLSVLLAGTSNEQTTLGRKTITAVTVTVDDTLERVDVDFADQVYVGADGNAISAFVLGYDPDTGVGTDVDIIVLTKHDFVADPDTTDLTVTVNNFFRAQN